MATANNLAVKVYDSSTTLNPCEYVTVIGATGVICTGVVREVHREFSYFEEAKTDITIEIDSRNNIKVCPTQLMSDIEKVIFSPPATIVFWSDGTKTVVKTSSHEMFDEEKGLAMAISEKYLGNYSRFKKMVENAQWQWW